MTAQNDVLHKCRIVFSAPADLSGGSLMRALESEIGKVASPCQQWVFEAVLTEGQISALQNETSQGAILSQIRSGCHAETIRSIDCTVL